MTLMGRLAIVTVATPAQPPRSITQNPFSYGFPLSFTFALLPAHTPTMNDTTISNRQRSYTLFLVIVFTASHVRPPDRCDLAGTDKTSLPISDTQRAADWLHVRVVLRNTGHADGDVGGSPQPPQSDRFRDLSVERYDRLLRYGRAVLATAVGSHRRRRWRSRL